jgi:hypothetical protein
LGEAPKVILIPETSLEPTQDEINKVVLAEKQDALNRSALIARFKNLRKEALLCTQRKH